MHYLRVARIILIHLDHYIIIGYCLVLRRGYKHWFGPLGMIVPLLTAIAASTLLSIRCHRCTCTCASLIFLELPTCAHILGQEALIAHIFGLTLNRWTFSKSTEQFLSTVSGAGLWVLVRIFAYRALIFLITGVLVGLCIGCDTRGWWCILLLLTFIASRVRTIEVWGVVSLQSTGFVLTIGVTACTRFFDLITGCVGWISGQFGLSSRDSVRRDHKIIQWFRPWLTIKCWRVQGWSIFIYLLLMIAFVQASKIRTHWLSLSFAVANPLCI